MGKEYIRRLPCIIADYQKPLHGLLLAMEMGLNAIRDTCPHFNEWLNKLETIEEMKGNQDVTK